MSENETSEGAPQLLRNPELVAWRFDRLRRAGYPAGVALPLAERADVDLELACRIMVQGATVDEAIRILT